MNAFRDFIKNYFVKLMKTDDIKDNGISSHTINDVNVKKDTYINDDESIEGVFELIKQEDKATDKKDLHVAFKVCADPADNNSPETTHHIKKLHDTNIENILNHIHDIGMNAFRDFIKNYFVKLMKTDDIKDNGNKSSSLLRQSITDTGSKCKRSIRKLSSPCRPAISPEDITLYDVLCDSETDENGVHRILLPVSFSSSTATTKHVGNVCLCIMTDLQREKYKNAAARQNFSERSDIVSYIVDTYHESCTRRFLIQNKETGFFHEMRRERAMASVEALFLYLPSLPSFLVLLSSVLTKGQERLQYSGSSTVASEKGSRNITSPSISNPTELVLYGYSKFMNLPSSPSLLVLSSSFLTKGQERLQYSGSSTVASEKGSRNITSPSTSSPTELALFGNSEFDAKKANERTG